MGKKLTDELTTKLIAMANNNNLVADKFSFRIHPEYDAELIAHLSGMDRGKRSRELRKIIRAGLRVEKEKTKFHNK